MALNTNTGDWTYTLDNTKAQSLGGGKIATEQFLVTASDYSGGSASQQVTITVTGVNDLPKISSSTVNTGSVQEDGTLVVNGAIVATDVDTTDVLAYSINNPVGVYGTIALVYGRTIQMHRRCLSGRLYMTILPLPYMLPRKLMCIMQF